MKPAPEIRGRFLMLVLLLLWVPAPGRALESSPATTLHSETVPPQAGRLLLSEAVQKAIVANPALAESNEAINQTQTSVSLARSYLYPNISGALSQGLYKDATLNSLGRFGGNSYDQYAASLRLTQTLFQIGSLSAINSASKDVRVSKLRADITRRDLTSSVIQAYYQIVLSARNVETLLAQEKIANETVNVSSRREKSGRGQLLDSLQAKTQLALLHGQLSTAQNGLEVANANLANLLGEKATVRHYKIVETIEPPKLEDVDRSFPRDKVLPIPELDIAEVAIQKIPDQRDVLWGQNLPTLGLTGGYLYTSYAEPDLFMQKANSWSVLLQLTIPIFSGFSLNAQDQALKSQQTQLQYAKANSENLFSYEQVTNRKNLETANDSIQTGNEALELARASLKEARRNYNLGTIDFLQYLNVQQTQVQAEQALNGYKYNYIVALTNYCVAFGQDINQLVKSLDSRVN